MPPHRSEEAVQTHEDRPRPAEPPEPPRTGKHHTCVSSCVSWKEHFQTGKDLFQFSTSVNWSFWSDFKYNHLNRWTVSNLTALFIQHFHLFAITGDPVTIKWTNKISSEQPRVYKFEQAKVHLNYMKSKQRIGNRFALSLLNHILFFNPESQCIVTAKTTYITTVTKLKYKTTKKLTQYFISSQQEN